MNQYRDIRYDTIYRAIASGQLDIATQPINQAAVHFISRML